jgi:hypothetical protein
MVKQSAPGGQTAAQPNRAKPAVSAKAAIFPYNCASLYPITSHNLKQGQA